MIAIMDIKLLCDFINFLSLLDEKRKILSERIERAKEKLEQIRCQLMACQENVLLSRRELVTFYKFNEMSKSDILKNIQNQERVLFRQQMSEQKIAQLKLEMLIENKIISQYQQEYLKTNRMYRRLSLRVER